MVMTVNRKDCSLLKICVGNTGKNRYLSALRMRSDSKEVAENDGGRSFHSHIVVWVINAAILVIFAHYMPFSL